MSRVFKKNIAGIPLTDSHGGAGKRRVLLSSSDPMSGQIQGMTNVYLPACAVFDWHKHDGADEFFIVLAGSGVVMFEDGSAVEFGKDDLVYIPADMSHRIENGDCDSEFFFLRVKP